MTFSGEDRMRQKSHAEELAEVRLTLASLRRRERQLELMVEQGELQTAVWRPGGAIQRVGRTGAHPH